MYNAVPWPSSSGSFLDMVKPYNFSSGLSIEEQRSCRASAYKHDTTAGGEKQGASFSWGPARSIPIKAALKLRQGLFTEKTPPRPARNKGRAPGQRKAAFRPPYAPRGALTAAPAGAVYAEK
jgi:hypothetical protein